MDDVDALLRERYVFDLRKPDVEKQERAVVIKKLLSDKNWSIREFSRKMGFKKSTVEDWLLWNDPRVAELKKKGLSDTEIYKVLRNNKVTTRKKKKAGDAQIVDVRLKGIAAIVKGMVSQGEYSDETDVLLKEVINQCNRFMSLIKREMNGRVVNGAGKKK